MEPFTFSRSEQVCIDQGQVEMTTADFMPFSGMDTEDIVQTDVFHPTAQFVLYQIHL